MSTCKPKLRGARYPSLRPFQVCGPESRNQTPANGTGCIPYVVWILLPNKDSFPLLVLTRFLRPFYLRRLETTAGCVSISGHMRDILGTQIVIVQLLPNAFANDAKRDKHGKAITKHFGVVHLRAGWRY
jgi:hypothetical protein